MPAHYGTVDLCIKAKTDSNRDLQGHAIINAQGGRGFELG